MKAVGNKRIKAHLPWQIIGPIWRAYVNNTKTSFGKARAERKSTKHRAL